MARIPDTYQEVEYLRGTGTQYIRTSYFATGNTSIKIKFRVNELQGYGIFGSRDTTTPTNAYLMWGASAGFWRAQYGNQNFVSEIERDTEWHTWEQRQNVCFLDNKLFHTFEKQSFQNTYEQLLFGIGGSATTISGLYIAKNDIGIVEYWENNELTMQLIPCYRKSDKTAGYYDTVLHEFLTNAGTGKFEVGPDVNKPELRMMYWKGNRLPDEYQELSYIESTGTQYILTDFIPTKTTNWEIKLSSKSSSTNWAMGSPTWVGVHYKKTQVGITNSAAASGQKYAEYNYDDTPITLKLQDKSVYADGNLLGTISRYNGTQAFSIFGYRNGNAATLLFSGKIYYVKLYNGEVLTNEFIPCFRKSDNVVGMYDTLAGKFYTNSGTGTFKKGSTKQDLRFFYAERNKIPNEYQEVEYIEGTGTQYIDAGIIGKTGEYKIRTKIRTSDNISGLQSIYGVRTDSGNTRFMLGFYTSSNQIKFDFAINTDNFGQVVETNTDYEFEADYTTATRTLKIDGSSNITSTASLNTGGNIYIFGYNRMWQPVSQMTSFFVGRIYKFEIIDSNNNFIMKLVPCYRKSDNSAGMFDLVSGRFLGNLGTGAFNKGACLALPSEYQEVSYIQSDGNQYINTGYTGNIDTEVNYKGKFISASGTFFQVFGNNVTSSTALTVNLNITGNAATSRFGNKTASMSYRVPNDTVISLKLNKDIYGYVDNKGYIQSSTINATTAFTTNGTLWFMFVNGGSYRGASQFYSATIVQAGQIVRDYKPCYRKSDGVIGVFDMITGTFLTNAGTGTFTKGTDVIKRTLRIIYM